MAQTRFQKVLILSSSGGLATLSGLVINMFLARYFAAEEFGTYRQALLVQNTVMVFILLGLPQALYYYVPRGERPIRQLISENVLLLALAGLAFPAFLLAGGFDWLVHDWADNPALGMPLLWLAALPLFAAPVRALTPCLMSLDRASTVGAFNLGLRVASVAMALAAVLWLGTVTAAVGALVVAAALGLPVGLWLMYRAAPPGPWMPTRAGVRQQLGFGIPLGVELMLGTLQVYAGNYAVAQLHGPAAFALYANGAVQIPFIGLITGSILSVILPELTTHLKNERPDQALALWRTAMTKSAMFLVPIMFYLLVLAEDTMTVVWSERYVESALIFQVFLLMLPIRGASFGSLYIAGDRRGLILIKTFASLVVTLALVIPLAVHYGPVGAAAGTVITIYVFTVPLNAVLLGRILGVSALSILPLRELLRIMLPAGLAALPLVGFMTVVERHGPDLLAGDGLGPVLRLGLGAAIYGAGLFVGYRVAGIRDPEDRVRGLLSSVLARLRPG